MGSDAYANTYAGVFIPAEKLEPFKVHHEAETHLEDRYDPTTGKKVEPEMVIDREERDGYELVPGEFTQPGWNDDNHTGEHLAELLGEDVTYRELYDHYGDSGLTGYVVGFELTNCGGFSYGCEASDAYTEVASIQDRLSALHRRLLELGIDILPTEFGIITTLLVSD